MTSLIEGEAPATRVRRHARELVVLALPVMVARAGQMTMGVMDTLFVGRFSAQELAYLGLGTAIQGVLLAMMAGLLLGTIVLTAQAIGGRRNLEAGAVWRRSIPYAAILGGVAGGLCLLAEPFFLLSGQAPDLAEGGAGVLHIIALGLPGAALFFTTSFFLEGLKKPVPGMIAMLLANVLNAVLDWLLVFGKFGLPASGAVGAAWATTIIRWVTAAGLIAYVWWMRDRDRFGIRTRPDGGQAAGRRQRHVGYAAGLSNGLEGSAFAALSLFAGWLGPLALGAYTVGLNLIALPFMAALGLASATAVRVGEAHGAGDRSEASLAGWTGLGVTSVLLALVGLGFILGDDEIARLFATDSALVAAMVPIIAFSAWILVVDGGQVVMAQALRGRGDTWIPTVLHFVSYYGVMIPISFALAIWAGRGVLGLFEGIFLASVVSVAVLSVRFAWLARR